MPLTEDEERAEHLLRMRVMQADLALKTKQVAWETPRNLAIIVGAVAAISAAIAGWTGYQIGRTPAAPTQIVFPPGTIIQVPPVVKP